MTFSRPDSNARRPWLLIALMAALLGLPAPRSSEAKMSPPSTPKEAKKFKKLIEGAREYFDKDVDIWAGRKKFEAQLNELAKNGQFPLINPSFMSWLVAQGRSFEPQFDDRKWAKANGIQVTDRGWWGYEVKGDEIWAHVREPSSYVDKQGKFDDVPRLGPWPVVLAMHRKRDPDEKKGAGRAWMESKWDKKTHADLFENWFTLMPIVAAAKYTDNGVIRAEKVFKILRDFWNRYHMDYDRVVVDGNEDALLLASTNGTPFLCGVIVRNASVKDGKLVSEKLSATLKNASHLPVYVVGKPEIGKALKAAGLTDVTDGDGQASLVKWMGERRRTMPKKFSWHVKDKDQQVAYWVSLDQPLWDAKQISVDVDISEKKPNEIDVKAIGISEMSFFLDDSLVNLSEPVKLTINGTLVFDAKMKIREKYLPVKRDLKEIFELPPVDVRKNRYYGWLKPGAIVRMSVPEPKEEGEKPGTTPEAEPATPKQEADAEKLYGKAKAAAEAGNKDRAIQLLEKVLKIPFNKQTEKARQLLEDLKK